ncbi:MAG: hypothetical protein ACOYMG_01410 [Candidatus Methylumidiphilus sp.]
MERTSIAYMPGFGGSALGACVGKHLFYDKSAMTRKTALQWL